MGEFGVVRSPILQALLYAPSTHCSHTRDTVFDPDSEYNVGHIGRISFAVSNAESHATHLCAERRCKRLQALTSTASQQRSQAVVGPLQEFQSAEITLCRDPPAFFQTRDTVSSVLLQGYCQRLPQRAFSCHRWTPKPLRAPFANSSKYATAIWRLGLKMRLRL